MLGDRALAAWLHHPSSKYHFATYTVANLNAGGNANHYSFIEPSVNLPLWHFIYMGYNRKSSTAFAYVKFKDQIFTSTLSNAVHYLTPEFSIEVGDEKFR